jgi:hypothetical protein
MGLGTNSSVIDMRPHHLLDIINQFGHGQSFEPHPYGHAVHLVAEAALKDLDLKVRFVAAADEICSPCIHLQANGQCDDLVRSVSPPRSKQQHNDCLDRRLFDYMAIHEGSVMTVRQFLQIVAAKLPGLERICAHAKEPPEERLKGLQSALCKLGIRACENDES